MANLEVLALDPTAPQIEAPQTGNGYSMPRLVNIAPEAVTGTAATPSVAVTQTWNTTGTPTALQVNVTDTASNAASKLLDLQVGGTSKFAVDKNGFIYFGVSTSGPVLVDAYNGIGIAGRATGYTPGGACQITIGNPNSTPLITANAAGNIGFSSSLNTIGAGAFQDTTLARDAANTFGQRNGVNAQAFNLYNTYTSGSVYERGIFDWTTTANTLTIGTQAAGGGTARNLRLVTQNSTGDYLQIQTNNYQTLFTAGNSTINFGATTIFSSALSSNISGNLMSAGYNGFVFADYVLNPKIGFRNGYPVDNAASNFSIVGNNAYSAATTNIVGGNLAFNAGNGASSSSGAAHGGNVTLAGGTGYGTGHNGYILMPNLPTSATGLPTGALWNNLGILSIA